MADQNTVIEGCIVDGFNVVDTSGSSYGTVGGVIGSSEYFDTALNPNIKYCDINNCYVANFTAPTTTSNYSIAHEGSASVDIYQCVVNNSGRDYTASNGADVECYETLKQARQYLADAEDEWFIPAYGDDINLASTDINQGWPVPNDDSCPEDEVSTGVFPFISWYSDLDSDISENLYPHYFLGVPEKVNDIYTSTTQYTGPYYLPAYRRYYYPDNMIINYVVEGISALDVLDLNKATFYHLDFGLPENRTKWIYEGVEEYNGEHYQVYKAVVVNTYTITYDLQGGTWNGVDPIEEYRSDHSGFDLPTPTRAGYNFYGWLTEQGTTITSINAGQTGNFNLTARWGARHWLLDFVEVVDIDGAKYDYSIEYGMDEYFIMFGDEQEFYSRTENGETLIIKTVPLWDDEAILYRIPSMWELVYIEIISTGYKFYAGQPVTCPDFGGGDVKRQVRVVLKHHDYWLEFN